MTRVYKVDAFTRGGEGGNAAGVVVQGGALDAATMQAIASAVGFSETAFIAASDCADYGVRFFAPSGEVALCGHATIASFHLLAEQGQAGAGTYRMETQSGVQEVTIDADGRVTMTQNQPDFGQIISPDAVVDCLGISLSDVCAPELIPIQICSTGLYKIFVPLESVSVLDRIVPDLDAVARVSRAHGAIGFYCFSTDTEGPATARCRNFAPVVGIAEDAATGTSAAALSCLLYHHKRLSGKDGAWLRFEQGDGLGQPSDIFVRLTCDDGSVVGVEVAGYGRTRDLLTVAETKKES